MKLPKFPTIFKWIRRHPRRSLLIGIGCLVLLFAFRPKASAAIETVTVTRGHIAESITASGTVDADKTATLQFLAGGKLVYLGAKVGDQVTAGQTIAMLDQRSLQDNLQSSLEDYAKTRNTYDQSLKTYNATSVNDAQTDAIKTILENNQNDLDKAVLSTQLQELAKEQSVLTTPIAGILIRSDVTSTGVNVSPTTVFEVADPDSLVFKVDVDESDIGKVTLNQTMKVNLDAFPDVTLTLPVSKIDFASHTTSTGGTVYTVEGDLGGSDGYKYRIGMNGDAEIITSEKNNVLVIPQSSLIDDTYVYVKTDKKKFEKRKVVLGLKNDTDAEVISGLSEGDEIAQQATDIAQPTQK